MNFINESNLSSLDIRADRVNQNQSIHGSNRLLPKCENFQGSLLRHPFLVMISLGKWADHVLLLWLSGSIYTLQAFHFLSFPLVLRVSSDGVMGGATFREQQEKKTKITKFETSLSI